MLHVVMFVVYVVLTRRAFVVIPLLYVFLNARFVQETIKAFEFEFDVTAALWRHVVSVVVVLHMPGISQVAHSGEEVMRGLHY